ncbi:MAG: phytanoyl-CoA dioxygenase family protein [Alphaproteobacteria bacterium]|nr:phytanoyl-CoA dioxygenase family protein [Alphaproteobacteria bacterium]
MKPEDVAKHPTAVLTEAQRAAYFADGYLVLPYCVPADWLARLRRAMAETIDRSRPLTRSDAVFTLEEGHSAVMPRLHRVSCPEDQHPIFWDFISDPVMTDLAADVVGPDVRFHHSKLNVKAGDGSRGFKWHQDIQAWPHTDYSPVTIGVYLEGCDDSQGPLAFVRGSHEGPLYSMYDRLGNFVVHVRDEELPSFDRATIDTATGGPGTVLLLNCRTLHGSATNRSTRPRPLLLSVYSSADSLPYTAAPIHGTHLGDIVRGKPAQFASFDTRPCELPPDWRGGYRTPWVYQHEEERRDGADREAALSSAAM